MSKAIIVAVVVVVVAIVAGVSAFLLLYGALGPSAGLTKALTTADGRTVLWAATGETQAKSVASTQFYIDHPDVPSEATLNMQSTPDENEEYWIVTVSYGGESEDYWVPQEKPKPDRMKVGQSLSYSISGSYQAMGQSGSITGSINYNIPEMVAYQGVQCFKLVISYDMTTAGISTSMSGYMYVDEDYRPRYANMTMETMLGATTMTIDYDYTNGKAIMTQDGTTIEIPISEDAFNQQYINAFVGEDLYVGWSKDFSYGYGTSMYTIKFTVVDEVLVTVPAGTFRCYKITASMPQTEGVQLSIDIYTNAQMTLVPKMTMDMQVTALGQTMSTSMVMELTSYSGF